MSQFQRRYTDRQKRAVGLAQIDGRKTAQQAVDALNGGTLTDGAGAVPPPAHPMPKTTAHDCARRIRQEREGRRGGLENAEPAAARAELGRRLTVAADRLTKRLERKSRTGTADAQLAESLAKAARACREVAAFHAAAEKPAKTPPPTPNGNGQENGKPADASPLGELAADIEREERSAAATRRQQSPSTQ